MAEIKKAVTAVFVLGMHRSGTSVVARALDTMGVDLGKNLLGGDHNNPKGYWEDKDIYRVNQYILETYTSDKDFALSLAGNMKGLQDNAWCAREIERIIALKSATSPLWGCKDPRLCLTFPIWKEHLLRQGVTPKVVIVYRNPLDVAKSLHARDRFSLDYALLLWFSYTYSIFRSIANIDSTIIEYERLLLQPELTLKNLQRSLNLDTQISELALAEFSQSFLDTSFRHHKTSREELERLRENHPEVLELYGLIHALGSDGFVSTEDVRAIVRLFRGANLCARFLSAIPYIESCFLTKHNLYFHPQLFVDGGEGFNMERSTRKPFVNSMKELTYTFTPPAKVWRLRLDPAEHPCIVENIGAIVERTGGTRYPIYPTRHSGIWHGGSTMLFDNGDPQILFDVDDEITAVTFRLAITPATESILLSICTEIGQALALATKTLEQQETAPSSKIMAREPAEEALLRAQNRITRLKTQYDDKKADLASAETDKEIYKAALAAMQQQNAEQSKTIDRLARDNAMIAQERRWYRSNPWAKRVAQWITEKGKRYTLSRDYNCIKKSYLFDEDYYCKRYPDAAAFSGGPLRHFIEHGWLERRDPSERFSTSYYLAKNPDVARSNINPLVHFITTGWKEGRNPSMYFDTLSYIAHHEDVQRSGTNPLVHYTLHGIFEKRRVDHLLPQSIEQEAELILDSGLFDATWYLLTNHDVYRAGVEPVHHYCHRGWREGRDPSQDFSTTFYLKHNQDVVESGLNPLIHYIFYGIKEERVASPTFLEPSPTAVQPTC
jgi:hypothetical protein